MGKEENDVESYLDQMVKEYGGFTRKWDSGGGVQDRICFFPEGEVWFIEVKTTDELPKPHQWREIMRQRDLGHNAGFLAGRNQVSYFMSVVNRVEWMTVHMSNNCRHVNKALNNG